jgi:hypothetical protein
MMTVKLEASLGPQGRSGVRMTNTYRTDRHLLRTGGLQVAVAAASFRVSDLPNAVFD